MGAREIEQIAVAGGQTCLTPTANIGVATWVAGETMQALLERVDRALYAAKAEGRNTVRPAAAPTRRLAMIPMPRPLASTVGALNVPARAAAQLALHP